jgi:hypothetical protein
LSRGQFAEIADQLVGIFACTDLCHYCLPPGNEDEGPPPPLTAAQRSSRTVARY